MGVRILYSPDEQRAVIYCSVTDWAFGPMFRDDGERDGLERAEAFLRWLKGYTPEPRDFNAGGRVLGFGGDPRSLTDAGLERAYTTWRSQEQDQKKVEGV